MLSNGLVRRMNDCTPLISINVAGHDRKTLLINKEIAQGHESQTQDWEGRRGGGGG